MRIPPFEVATNDALQSLFSAIKGAAEEGQMELVVKLAQAHEDIIHAHHEYIQRTY